MQQVCYHHWLLLLLWKKILLNCGRVLLFCFKGFCLSFAKFEYPAALVTTDFFKKKKSFKAYCAQCTNVANFNHKGTFVWCFQHFEVSLFFNLPPFCFRTIIEFLSKPSIAYKKTCFTQQRKTNIISKKNTLWKEPLHLKIVINMQY